MKTKSSKQSKQTKPAVPPKDLAAKKNPKAGRGNRPSWVCGSDFQHNETLLRDNAD